MNLKFWGLLLLFLSPAANAVSLEGFYRASFYNVQQSLNSTIDENAHSRSCEPQIVRAHQDGVLNITLALGYMDVSGNLDAVVGDNRKYTLGSAVDPQGYNSIADFLTRKCTSSRSPVQLCGFRKSRGRFTKTFRKPKRVRVQINLISSAHTSSDSRNRQDPKQVTKSEQAQNKFLNALKNQDVVIYMGHARSGGGPDFSPPVYSSGHQVDYSHYRRTQPGLRAMLGALAATTSDAPIIGLLACKSTGLFSSAVRANAPGSMLVTADTLFDYDEILPTGLAMVGAVIGHQCGDSLTRAMKVGVTNPNELNIFR
ncbi:MAG: hypothetical protein AAF202_03325 [Pseudomonadota bacterium]